MGAKNAVATDIDPLAVRAAKANATLNGVQQQMQVLPCGPSLQDPDPVSQVSYGKSRIQGSAGPAMQCVPMCDKAMPCHVDSTCLHQ
jgi:ribosomal protein L11 methylase PrmA